MSRFVPVKYCWHCDKSMGLARSDARFCSDKCRIAWNRLQAKIAKAGIDVPSHEELATAKITISWKVFTRDLSVVEAIQKGLIRIELQPEENEAQNEDTTAG